MLLTGADDEEARRAKECGAEALVRKPFSPLDLLATVEALAGRGHSIPARRPRKARAPEEEVLLYARDLQHLLEVERGQRTLLQDSYLETVTALAIALESRDMRTHAHSHRVERYAVELLATIDAQSLIDHPEIRYGFLLHDVGKIGIPDGILQKPGPLTDAERAQMQTHTVIGEQMLGGVAFLQGEGLKIVRSHHERWDGAGYPDGIAGDGHSARGPRLRGCRLARRDDERPAVPQGAQLERRVRRDPRAGRGAVRSRRGRCIPQSRARPARDAARALRRVVRARSGDRPAARLRHRDLLPERDLPVAHDEERRGFHARRVAMMLRALTEHEGRDRAVAR